MMREHDIPRFDLRRLVSALFVVLLHVAIIAGLLRGFVQTGRQAAPAHEIIVQFVRPAPERHNEHLPPPAPLVQPSPSETPSLETTAPPRTHTAPNGGDLRGLYLYLYECGPENFATLTEEQRTKCASASIGPRHDETNALRNQPSRALDAGHWQTEMARDKNPFVVVPTTPSQEKESEKMLRCAPNGTNNGINNSCDNAVPGGQQ